MSIDINALNNELAHLATGNEEYALFNKRIVNTNKKVLGVRTPDLRKLAKRHAKDISFAEIEQFLNEADKDIYEQTMLGGMIINYAKLSDVERIHLAKEYLGLTDSWAEIDMFAQKRRTFDDKLWWNFAVESLGSPNEFIVRYGVIEMMSNFLNEKYIDKVFEELRGITHDGYYVRMGMAWLYATAAIKFYDHTLREIKNADLNIWTKKKALTKMLESHQFTTEQKEEIRLLRGKLDSAASAE